MRKGQALLGRLLLGSVLANHFWLASVNAENHAGIKELNMGTADEAIYGLGLSGSNAVAVGQAGLVLQSTDLGDTWVELERFTESALLDVDCGTNVEIYVGQGGELYRRSKGVVKAIQSGTDARLMSVAQSQDGEIAVAVGAFGTILTSVDAGENWVPSTLDWFPILNDYVEPHLYDVHVSNVGLITIVGEFSLVLQSSDAGKSWVKRHLGEASLFGLNMDHVGSGYAVGQEGILLKTTDEGTTWKPISTLSNDILLNVTSIDESLVLATGIRKLIFSSDQGNSWKEIEAPAFSTGWYQGLSLLPETRIGSREVLLAGHRANILKIKLQ